MINLTTSDLHDILQTTENSQRTHMVTATDQESSTQDDDERTSLQKCLEICTQFSVHIDKVQRKLVETATKLTTRGTVPVILDESDQAWRRTQKGFDHCKNSINLTSSELRTRLHDIDQRVARLPSLTGPGPSPEESTQKVAEEVDSIRHCLSICTEATKQARDQKLHIYEDVEIGSDGHQVIVATLGDLIEAKGIKAGDRSTQWLGQMSDASLQQLSRRHSGAAVTSNVEDDTDPPRAATRDQDQKGRQDLLPPQFENRHGTGRKLT